MARLGPVTVTTPRFLSGDLLYGVAGATGGMLFADYIASSAIIRGGWTGSTAIAAAAAVKLAMGGLMYYGATKTEGVPEKLLYVGFIGSLASIGLDLYHWYKPGAGESATVRAARLGVRRAVAPALRVAPAAAPAVALRPETPSGAALGGF